VVAVDAALISLHRDRLDGRATPIGYLLDASVDGDEVIALDATSGPTDTLVVALSRSSSATRLHLVRRVRDEITSHLVELDAGVVGVALVRSPMWMEPPADAVHVLQRDDDGFLRATRLTNAEIGTR
jgi:hypothetical protein